MEREKIGFHRWIIMLTADLPRLTLLLGGARSGKSRRAQTLAEESGLVPVMIATAQAGDSEMAERIGRHRAERSQEWMTIEEPLEILSAIGQPEFLGHILVVDCLTLWLSNLFFSERLVEHSIDELASGLARLDRPCILVSNELGLGIVPENELARTFRDAQGRLNQRMAQVCDHVELIVAGLPLRIKP